MSHCPPRAGPTGPLVRLLLLLPRRRLLLVLLLLLLLLRPVLLN